LQLQGIKRNYYGANASEATLGCASKHDQWNRECLVFDLSGASADYVKLIEVGRALRAADKEGGRTLTNANTRLKSFFPGAIDNFHQALDDLECDIVSVREICGQAHL
jgi:hypothetical protein